MYNVLLLEKDLEYGRKLMNKLSLYNDDLRFCLFINNENEVDNEISKNIDVMLVGNSDLIVRNYNKLKEFEDRIIVLENSNNDITNNILQISKSESIENINNEILKLVHESSYKENYIKSLISDELRYLGYSPKYNGTKYLCEAIYVIYKNNEENSENLKREVYPVVAEKFGRTAQNIKCNIINATDIMICECEEKRLIDYLGFYNYVKPGPKKIMEAVYKKVKEKEK